MGSGNSALAALGQEGNRSGCDCPQVVSLHKLILHAAVSGVYCSVRVAWSLGKEISAFPRKVVYRYLSEPSGCGQQDVG